MTRALVVDDDAFMRATTAAILTQLGVTEQWAASNGDEALASLAEHDVDLMLCDLNMPGMDGISLLRHVAAVSKPPAVVLFSGEDGRVLHTAETLASAHKLEVLGAIGKDPATLRDQLAAMVEKLQQRAAQAKRRAAGGAQELLTPAEIHEGLERGMLVPAFQPQIDTMTGRVVGLEALARWEHPTRGLLGPWAFIGVAEKYGLIGEITRRMLELSIEQLGVWHRHGHDFTVSVNVSVDDLADVAFADVVLHVLDAWSVPADKLLLEVTESKIMRDIAAPLEVLTRLMMKQVRFALDDYGTGASSMEQLARIPFDELKIDRQFVSNALNDASARSMLESAVDLAKRLGLDALAEGVETQEEWDLVRELGCHRLQGYFVAPPLTAARFDEWLVRWTQDNEIRAEA